MAVLGWIALGLVTGVLVSGFRHRDEGHGARAGRCALGMVGAVLAGLVATAAGVGSIGDFLHIGAWLIAIGGAVLAVVGFDVVRRPRDDRDLARATRRWAGRTAGESERLDRNW